MGRVYFPSFAREEMELGVWVQGLWDLLLPSPAPGLSLPTLPHSGSLEIKPRCAPVRLLAYLLLSLSLGLSRSISLLVWLVHSHS